ncbi:hypothetical protein BESB_027570 [Besnoitia besnoiti]|uniref:Uncharacterized protein n=1 Tax=Besnoitia besnoiti TaxID=94643 RepID=A0A2A9M7H7_BESBE|nr:uncharacterized protein BESB_027570 [Besnoitia besnoiti]PFH31322.1 hypothetical protein BESB_027570 [Besnoitia besnoiti]
MGAPGLRQAAIAGQPVHGLPEKLALRAGFSRQRKGLSSRNQRSAAASSGFFSARLPGSCENQYILALQPVTKSHVARSSVAFAPPTRPFASSSFSTSAWSASASSSSAPHQPSDPSSSRSGRAAAGAPSISSWWWRLAPLAFPLVGFGLYWEQRRRRMLAKDLPALRARFQGDTPFYGKLWGYTTDYFLENSFGDGDLVFLSRDHHSFSFSRAAARAVTRCLLLILPAGGPADGSQRFALGGGMCIDDVGVIFVENGQRYVVSLSAERSGLEKVKYADKVAESFPEAILVRRLRCSPEVREKVHHAIEEALRQSQGVQTGEIAAREEDAASCSASRAAPSLDFHGSATSVWSSFWTEVKRRRAASADAFRLLTAQAFWTAKRRTAALIHKRLQDLLHDAESSVAPGVMENARTKATQLFSEDSSESDAAKEAGPGEASAARGDAEEARSGDSAGRHAGAVGSTESIEGVSIVKPRDTVNILAELVALSTFAERAIKRIDEVFQDKGSPPAAASSTIRPASQLPLAAFPVAVYQAAQLLPPLPSCREWTPEDLLAIEILFQPADLCGPRAAETEGKNVQGGAGEETRSELAKTATLELASLSPQLAPILYVREEKGERDCVARKNMPGLIRQRERAGRKAAAGAATAQESG